MRLDSDVLEVLAAAEADGSSLKLAGQLDRTLYAKVAKAIEAAGGKWNRKAQAHLFRGDAAPVIAQMLGNGSVISERTDQQFFPTPPDVADRLISAADLDWDHVVLEPSAGEGAIADRVASRVSAVDCIEMYEQHAAVIRAGGYARSVVTGDFLAVEPRPAYDRVVMNPPFTGGQDIAHVMHAVKFLKPGGLLVSVMALGVTFRNDRRTSGFRQYVDAAGGWLDSLPDGAFAESGTGVKTVMAVIPEPGK